MWAYYKNCDRNSSNNGFMLIDGVNLGISWPNGVTTGSPTIWSCWNYTSGFLTGASYIQQATLSSSQNFVAMILCLSDRYTNLYKFWSEFPTLSTTFFDTSAGAQFTSCRNSYPNDYT